MKTLEKHGVSLLKGTLIIYLIFNFVNYIVHFIRIPAVIEAEYAIYGFKIFLDLMICVLINKGCIALKRCEIFMRSILILDILEVFISLTVVEMTHFIVGLFSAGIVLKLVLEIIFFYIFYVDSLAYLKKVKGGKTEDKFTALWILLHFFMPLGLFEGAFGFFYFIIFARSILMLLAVFSGMKRLKVHTDEVNANTEPIYAIRSCKPITKILAGIVVSAAVICFLFFRYSYTEGEVTCELTDQKSADGFYWAVCEDNWEGEQTDCEGADVLEYTLANRMPEWSGFYLKKAGFVNVKTGENTGAKYKGRLRFDGNEMAYDNDECFINCKGEVICKVPKCVSFEPSIRCKVVRTIKDYTEQDDAVFEIFSEKRSSKKRFIQTDSIKQYFADGVAVYYSELYEKYGLMSINGELLTEPIYPHVRDFYKTGTVVFEEYCDVFVYNSKGELLIDGGEHIDYSYANIYGLDAIYLPRTDKNAPECFRFINGNGELIDGVFKDEDTVVLDECWKIKCKRYKDETLSDPGEWVYFDKNGNEVEEK